MDSKSSQAAAAPKPVLLVCGDLSEELWNDLSKTCTLTQYRGPNVNIPTTSLAPADFLVIRSPFRIIPDVLQRCSKLRLVIRAGAGMEDICEDVMRLRGIPFYRLALSGASVAEHAYALLLSAAREIPKMSASVAERRWEKSRAAGVELEGKVIHVVGFGDIGRRIARIALGFGLTVLITDPSPQKPEKKEVLDNSPVSCVTLEKGLCFADIVVLCASLNKTSRGMIDESAIFNMKNGVILINVGRADLIERIALESGLRAGKFSAVGLDVHYNEPNIDWDLLSDQRIIATPHIAAQTKECRARIEAEILRLITLYRRGG